MRATGLFKLAVFVSSFAAAAGAAAGYPSGYGKRALEGYPSGYGKRALEGYPSGYGKRALSEASSKLLCPMGLSTCQIIGRGAESWECVDTHNDLESCGGCMIQSSYLFSQDEGVDCTAIPGISDVSCVEGKCLVRRCMAGFVVNKAGDSCVQDLGSPLLISQSDLI